MGNYKFDFDLPEGQAAERLVREILCGECGPVEVKRDFKASATGNVAIEFKCRGRPSGISTSTALWWAIVLDGAKYGHEVAILIKTSRLRAISKHLYKQGKWTRGGDDKASEMVLIPVAQLVQWYPKLVSPSLI